MHRLYVVFLRNVRTLLYIDGSKTNARTDGVNKFSNKIKWLSYLFLRLFTRRSWGRDFFSVCYSCFSRRDTFPNRFSTLRCRLCRCRCCFSFWWIDIHWLWVNCTSQLLTKISDSYFPATLIGLLWSFLLEFQSEISRTNFGIYIDITCTIKIIKKL